VDGEGDLHHQAKPAIVPDYPLPSPTPSSPGTQLCSPLLKLASEILINKLDEFWLQQFCEGWEFTVKKDDHNITGVNYLNK